MTCRARTPPTGAPPAIFTSMCPTPAPRTRRKTTTSPSRRTLRTPAAHPSCLLRGRGNGRCPACGHRIECYPRADHRPLYLHPAEFTTTAVPAAWRWHLSSGIAHPHGDGSAWCRLPHAALCPARTPDPQLTPHLTELRRHLAVRTRILIDTGLLTPRTPACPPPAELPRTPAPTPGAPPC
jgi:hypothetical protein